MIKATGTFILEHSVLWNSYQIGCYWGLSPHGHFSFLLKHTVNSTHTPHAAWQKTDSRFECQTLDTHIVTTSFFFFFCQKWVIETAHRVRSPPTRVCIQLCGTIDQTLSHFLSLLLSPIKKKGTGGCVKTTLFFFKHNGNPLLVSSIFWISGKTCSLLPLTTYCP